jgi:hypothetical protein
MGDDRGLNVVDIKPDGWDATVQEHSEAIVLEALELMRKNGCRGVAISWVERDRSTGTLYSKSSAWGALTGGVSKLLHRMHADD